MKSTFDHSKYSLFAILINENKNIKATFGMIFYTILKFVSDFVLRKQVFSIIIIIIKCQSNRILHKTSNKIHF